MRKPKKPLFLFFLFLTFTISLSAQDFGGGLRLGVAFSQVDGDMRGGFHKIGFTGGGFVNYPLTKKTLFQGELLFTQKGAYDTPSENSSDRDVFEISANYIDIPLFIDYNFVDKFHGQIGIMPSVLVTGSEKFNDTENERAPGFNRVDFSFLLGIAYQFGKHFSVGINWSHSLLNIRDGLENGYSKFLFDYGQYNQVVSITASYHF